MSSDPRPISLTYAPPLRPAARKNRIVDRQFLLVVMILGVLTVAYCRYRRVFMP
jgi:hypothetical protein